MPEPRHASPDARGPTVFIGPRPTMSYVFEVAAQLHSGAGPVVVKARGLAIAKAVDVVEVVRNKFLLGAVSVDDIQIGTERLTNRTGRETNVSSIAIALRRTGSVGPAPDAPTAPEPPATSKAPRSPPGSPPGAGVRG